MWTALCLDGLTSKMRQGWRICSTYFCNQLKLKAPEEQNICRLDTILRIKSSFRSAMQRRSINISALAGLRKTSLMTISEIRIPTIVAVSGLSSNTGKTTLARELLTRLPGWEAIKLTRGHY